MASENYGFIIGFGTISFFIFLFVNFLQEDLGINQELLNMLAVFGGIGFVSMIFGFYMLFKDNRVSEDMREKHSKEQKSKQINDDILKKYDNMPDLALQSFSSVGVIEN